MIVKSAKLTLITDDDTEVKVNVTPAKLKAILGSCGLAVKGEGKNKCVLLEFNDESIKNNVLPLLPKVK